MRLLLKRLFHCMRKRTYCTRSGDGPSSGASLSSGDGNLSPAHDPSPQCDDLNPWGDDSSSCDGPDPSSFVGIKCGTGSKYFLMDLNCDVLHCIMEEALLQGCLKSLSVTCKAIREAAEPLLFRRCNVTHGDLGIPIFPPASLWRHIRYLSLDVLRPSLRLLLTPSYNYLNPGFLSAAFQSMPLLRGITFWSANSEDDGLPWSCLRIILATPRLRELALKLPASGVMEVSIEDLDAIALPPLTSLTYSLSNFRADPRWLPTEKAALTLILEKASHSLQSLTMSSESAPLDILRDSYWPCLRDLDMRGEAAPHLEIPYVITLGNMSELRSLKLGLTLRPGVTAPIIWPSGYDAACPWPHLRSFTVCHPNLEDEIYGHLPPTLRRLLLCSYPYHHDIIWAISAGMGDRQLQKSLLAASKMLELLSRCQTPDLTALAMEFHADDQELDLWHFLPRAFPRLTSLAVNIHRSKDTLTDDIVPRIARALAPLAHLKTLRMHLGLMPSLDSLIRMRLIGGLRHDFTKRVRGPVEERHKAACDRAAQTFAETLSPSLHTIFLLHPKVFEQHWIQYRIIPGKQPRNKNRAGRYNDLPYARGVILVAVEGSDRIITS